MTFCLSGSGKSTLIKLVNGLEVFQPGDMLFKRKSQRASGTSLSRLRTRIGMVFQRFGLFFHLSVLENLTIAQFRVLRCSTAEAEKKAVMSLDRVGMSAHIGVHKLVPDTNPWTIRSVSPSRLAASSGSDPSNARRLPTMKVGVF